MKAEIVVDNKKKFSLGIAPSASQIHQNITNSQKTIEKKINEKVFFGSGIGSLRANQSKK